jgi:hypothetical protein
VWKCPNDEKLVPLWCAEKVHIKGYNNSKKKKPGTKTGITLAGLVQGGKTRGI